MSHIVKIISNRTNLSVVDFTGESACFNFNELKFCICYNIYLYATLDVRHIYVLE